MTNNEIFGNMLPYIMKIKKTYLAVTYIIISAFCFTVMNLCIRYAGDMPVFEKSFFRNLISLMIAGFILKKDRLNYKFKGGEDIAVLLLRSLFGSVGIFCNFYAVDHLLIADASILNKMSPFFAIIFSFFILSERVKPYQIICIFIAFIGVLFVIKPGGSVVLSFPFLVGLFGGMCAGLAYTMVRYAKKRDIPTSFIVFFFSVFSCVFSLMFSVPDFVVPSISQVLIMILAGLSAAGGQFAITSAYSHAPASEISIYEYAQIIFASLLGAVLFLEMPDRYSILGYIIIFGTSLFMFFKVKNME